MGCEISEIVGLTAELQSCTRRHLHLALLHPERTVMRWLALILFALPATAQDHDGFETELFTCYYSAEDRAERLACKDAVARPCMSQEGGETTIGMSMCLNDEAQAWDQLLNEEYRETMAYMKVMDDDEREYFPEYAKRQEALRDAQRAWIAFRDAECALAYAEWGSGSHRHIAGTACMADMTADRTIGLRDMRERFE